MKTFFTAFSCFFLFLILPPSVSAQRRTVIASNECRKIISLDLGAHRLFADGPFAGHFGLNIESIVSEKFTFNFNVKDFINRYSRPTTERGLVEHRVVLQPSMSFYPLYALHGFYASVGCGAYVYLDNSKNNSTISEKSFFQPFPDVKLGFQSISADNLAWNVYLGSGVFIPKRLYDAIPVFELGMKLGLKL